MNIGDSVIMNEKYVVAEKNQGKVFLAMGNAYVRHRAGINEDHEPCVGWWLEYSERKRSCPC